MLDTDKKVKKYKITVGNISVVIFLIFVIYFFINPGPMGYGMLAGIGLFLFCIIIFLVDLFFQKTIKNYLTLNIVELILLIISIVFV